VNLVDDYIAGFPADVQPVLQDVRAALLRGVPGGVETISYGIPTLELDGRKVVHFAGWKQHVGIYPLPSGDPALDAALAPYVTGRGTARFPLDLPLPYDLVEALAAQLVVQRA
jgi:uncharacterized protein YdhG (YjbR/CyaY superfamily)